MLTLTRHPLDVSAALAAVAAAGAGGTALFVGTVRSSAADGPVIAIEYLAYNAMALAEWDRIVAEALRRWPDGRFAGQHRIGLVPLGEASIVVAVGMPHRAEAFEACQWVVDQAKARLPVWKKEQFEGGRSAWRENEAGLPQRSGR